MNDINMDALAEEHYAPVDPQNISAYQEEEAAMRDMYEELDSIFEETKSQLMSFHDVARRFDVYQNKLVHEVCNGFDQALDALETLKGEILSEISDY